VRIAQIAPLYERVPPQLYGGTERVVSYLTEELVRLGHEVTLFASGDSITQARLVAPRRRALRLDPSCQDTLAPHIQMLSQVYRRAQEFDIIHCHTDYLTLPFTRFTSTPTLLTLHGRLDIPELAPLYREYADVPLVSISDNQRLALPEAHWVATVYHGLPPDLYAFQSRPSPFLLFLGRISPEKQPDSAIRVARRAGVPLKIAAKVDKVDREYFETTVRPLLDHPLVELIGEVDEEQKRALLGEARALLFPIDWPEPFGLVMIEALACGTPVIARPRGSVPEVLRDGKTGLLCETEDEMVQAIRRVVTLNRGVCRREFEERFTSHVMAQRYLEIYQRCGSVQAHVAPSAKGVVVPSSIAVDGTEKQYGSSNGNGAPRHSPVQSSFNSSTLSSLPEKTLKR
jgi:glycosyltransferase involved in cell wall biosynthesis